MHALLRGTLAAALLAAAAGLSGCAGVFGGAKADALPPLEAGKARIVVYRISMRGAAWPPEVMLNGESLGRADRSGMAWRDVPPGSYTVATSQNDHVLHFLAAAGERKYVRLAAGFFDDQVRPELVDPGKGASDVAGLGPFGPTKPPAKK